MRARCTAAFAHVALVLLALLVHHVDALEVKGETTLRLKGNEKDPVLVSDVSVGGEMLKYAFSSTGVLKANLNATWQGMDKSNCFQLAVCDVTDELVRDISFRSSRSFFSSKAADQDSARSVVCRPPTDRTSSASCTALSMGGQRGVLKRPTRRAAIEYIALFGCPCLLNDGEQDSTWPANPRNVAVQYNILMSNPDAAQPQLGWNEEMYPIAPIAVAVASSSLCAIVIFAAAIAWTQRARIPFVVRALLVAVVFKTISATITAVVYWRYSMSGVLAPWFFKLRIPLIIVDDLLMVLLMLAMSMGTGLVPSSWILELRSGTFVIALGIAIKIVMLIADAIIPLEAGFSTSVVCGALIGLICVHHSRRIGEFIAKYVEVVRLANIDVDSTPLVSIHRFFSINVVIVTLAWLALSVSIGVLDLKVRTRPDVLWTVLEIIDVGLLAWYAVAVFPRRKCAFYIDLSDVNNDRLRKVIAWRVRQQKRDESSEGTDTSDDIYLGGEVDDEKSQNVLSESVIANNDRRSAVDDPEPEIVKWDPRMKLPVPMLGMLIMEDNQRSEMLERQLSSAEDTTVIRLN